MVARAWPFWKTIPRFDREYGLGDLFRAVRALSGFDGLNYGTLEDLGTNGSEVYLARSGRECLYLILKMLALPPRSRVGVPLYCCGSVFEAIAAAGHIPVFLDIDVRTYELQGDQLARRRKEIDALVVVHLFGYPADFQALRDSLADRNIPIIEDCAHALFSEYRGSRVGSCAVASFHTFGMHKPAAAGGGAALVINDRSLAPAAEREFARLYAETGPDQIRHSLTCWARSVSYQRAVYGALLGSPLGRYRDKERPTAKFNGAPIADKHFPPSRIRLVDRVLIRQRINEFRAKLSALAANAERLREAIGRGSLCTLAEPVHGKWNHFMFPVRYGTARQRDMGRKFLLRRRVDTSPLYQNCARNARRFGYAGGCNGAELVAKTICTVPNHPWLTREDIAYIGESLRRSAELI